MPDQQGGNYRTQWTQQLGSQGDDYAFSIAADRLGGIYMAGLTFGDLGSSNAGIDDAWLAKYDTSGNQLWTKQLGTSEGDRAYKMNTDSAGNIYLTGTTKGILGKNSAGDWDAWIGKYDSNGNQLWIQQLGSATTDESSSTATDNAGNTYLTGATWGNLAGSNAGKWDAWIAQYDSNGNQVWAKQIGTPEEDHSYAIAVDNQGNAYLAGYTQGNLFAPNAGNWDAWIAKYDRNGNQIWGQQIGTPSEDQAKGIATDSQGNIYLTGWTEGAMSENQGSFDAWMAKYDPNGNQLWIQQLGSAGSEGALDLTIDSEDRIYLTGNTWGDLASPNAGNNDAWAAEYNSDGNLLWKRQLGTAGEDLAFGVAVGEPGKLYIGGWTDGAFTQNSGGTDAWLAQLLPNNAPELSDISVEGKENPQITFTAENFLQAFTDSNGDSLVKVQITSLPENGSLTLNGNPVTENQEIETSQLENLKFIPTFGFTGQTSFTWNGYDGMNYAATPATANLTISPGFKDNPNIEWIRQFGTNARDFSNGVAVDSTGNIYLTGKTKGDLGGANAGDWYDAWVAKYDPQGNQLWLQQFGTNNDDASSAVAVDDTGNVYLTGQTLYYSNGANTRWYDAWIAKYDPQGNQLWLQQFGSANSEYSNSVTVDATGNVYLTGATDLSRYPEYIWDDDRTKYSRNLHNPWVAKYDPQGNQLWLQHFGSDSWMKENSQGVVTDAAGNFYLTGYKEDDLGGANAGAIDAWVAKYDSSGNQLWLQQFGNHFIDSSNDVAVDSTGNVYLTGETLGYLGNNDAWVAKYDPQGNQLWVQQQFRSASDDYSNGVTVDAAGNVYLLGYSRGGNYYLWVAKYDSEGNQIWLQQFGTGNLDYPSDVALDDTGNLYLTGSTYGDLGGQNAGGDDAWVAKLSQDKLQAPVEISGSEADDRLTGGIGNEVLLGYEGNDTLNGNGGNDTLTGVNGSDVFVLASGSGSDVITDFVDGTDMLQLAGDLTFEQLTILPGTDGTLINLGANLLATLTGIDASLITQEDFAVSLAQPSEISGIAVVR